VWILVNAATKAATIKTLALETGFDLVGITSVDPPREATFLKEWVARGFAGDMRYLTSQVALRMDPRAAYPGARSIVCLGVQYDTPHPYSTAISGARGWISRYAWGDDYHDTLRQRLHSLEERIKREIGDFGCHACVDTGPVLERVWAAAAGLGAWGKNCCLVHPEHGSWFYLAELVTDLDLPFDAPRREACGRCRACLDVCPTGALREPYVLDATRCVSYLTIELRGSIPEDLRPALGRHVFGCDLCQEVCPWNRKRRRRGGGEFEPRMGLFAPRLDELARLRDEDFRRLFHRSAIKRAKLRGLLRNVCVALGNTRDARQRDALRLLAADRDDLVQTHALWALDRFNAD
jgi:epoxyqueuosine reductase